MKIIIQDTVKETRNWENAKESMKKGKIEEGRKKTLIINWNCKDESKGKKQNK